MRGESTFRSELAWATLVDHAREFVRRRRDNRARHTHVLVGAGEGFMIPLGQSLHRSPSLHLIRYTTESNWIHVYESSAFTDLC